MNEKTNTTGANNGTRGCERAQEMVTYLYGEAAPNEAKDFRRHLTSCNVCRDELAAFGSVREIFGEWRGEVMGAIPSLGIDESFANATGVHTSARTRKLSAIAALREFFSLSPVWMQAGVVAATLVLFALAALTLARVEVRWDANGFAFNMGAKERIVEKEKLVQAPVSTGFTQEQVNAQIAAAHAKWEEENVRQVETVPVSDSRQPPASRTANSTSPKHKASGVRQRNQLAEAEAVSEDFFNPNEDRVPRLTDLLGAVKAPNNPNER